MTESDTDAQEPKRPHSVFRFRAGVVVLVLAGIGFCASLFTHGLLLWVSKGLWACALPGSMLVIYGWRGPDPVSSWPDKR